MGVLASDPCRRAVVDCFETPAPSGTSHLLRSRDRHGDGRATAAREAYVYWRDRNLKFHEYKSKRPTKNVQALLDHIGTSGDPIFWGWRAAH